jgi:hypothetical protein
MTKQTTLEQRIGTVLTDDNSKSSVIAALVAETETAIAAATRTPSWNKRGRLIRSLRPTRRPHARRCRRPSLCKLGCAQLCCDCNAV